MPVAYKSTKDIKDAASNQRDIAQSRGDELLRDQGNEIGANEALRNNYRSTLDRLYQGAAEGQGGYSPEEAAAIQAQGGLPTALTDDQAQGNFLTPEEQAAIKGDPGSYTRNFNPDQMSQDQTVSAGLQRGAVAGLKQGLANAVRPDDLKQSGKFQQDSANQLDQNQGQFGTVLGAVGDNVRGAIDPSAVQASDSFLADYNMSPEEEQRIVTGAGISAGAKDAAAVDAAERSARASGASPMGVAAYRSRMARAQAADAGDAMTQARIKASEAAAGRKLTGEQLREQGGRYLTDTKTGAELRMGEDALSGTQHLGDQALDERARVEQQRLNAEQSLAGTQLTAAGVGGQADIANEANINQEGRQQQQFNTTTGTNIAETQDKAAADRAMAVAGNRQATAVNNQGTQFGQAKTVNDTTSVRAKTVADTRLDQQQKGLNYYQGQDAMANQNAENAQGRQVQTYGTQMGATNAAVGQQADAAKQPGTFSKVVSGVTNLVAAAGGAGGIRSAATGKADGRTGGSDEFAVVGEDGPEWVGNLTGEKQPWWKELATGAAKTGLRAALPGLPLADGRMGEGGGGSDGGQIVDHPTLVSLDSEDSVVPLSYRARAKVRPSAVMASESVRRGRTPYAGAA